MDTQKTEIMQGMNLLTYLREKGYSLASPCGGRGICGKCRIRVLSGDRVLSRPYPGLRGITQEEWQMGWRLACQTVMDEEMTIQIPDYYNSDANILTKGEHDAALQPCIQKVYLELPKPSLEDQAGDIDRLMNALVSCNITDLSLMQTIPGIIRDYNYKVTAILHDSTVIGVEGGDTSSRMYGAAVDIGTTTIAGVLIDLRTGEEIGIYSALNPQKCHGDDVISRIGYTMENEQGLLRLQQMLLDCLNRMFEFFEEKYGISPGNIYQVCFAGNTVMMHLLAGLPVSSIATVPFQPAATRLPVLKASELSLIIYPGAVIYFLPMISGYIGADTAACILAADMLEQDKLSLLVDIGTNGEIVLGSRKGLLACAAAAGPALEGAHIQCGMGGVRGAVSKVEVHEDRICYETIGNAPATGICGSGIVDALAGMLKAGLLDTYGRMLTSDEAGDAVPAFLSARIREFDGKPSFILLGRDEGAENDIIITQKDVREIQLAKAAIAAGIKILMKEMQVGYDDIHKVYLAGGFGNYINHDNAMEIGLLPAELKDRVVHVGNASLTGAKMIAMSRKYVEEAEKAAQMTRYIELSSRADFQEIFIENMEFPQICR